MILKSNGSLLAAAALFGGVMAVAGAAHATSIGVQFVNASNTNSVALTAAQVAGAGSYAQSNWNVASSANQTSYTDAGGSAAYEGSLSTLTDGTTAATSVGANGGSVTFNYSDIHKFFTGYTIGASGDPSNTTTDANAILMSGAVENDTNSATKATVLEFGNVAPGSYNVVLYNVWQASNEFQASVNGGAPVDVWEQAGQTFGAESPNETWVTNPNPSASTDVSNYLVFNNISPDSNGNISLAFLKNSSSLAGSEGVNAIQLVSTPEPAPLALLALGGLGLMLLQRKTRMPA